MEKYHELLLATNEKFEKEIFPLLEQHDLLVHYKGLVDGSFPKILDRLELQKESIHEKIMSLANHMSKHGKLDGFDKALLRDLVFLIAQTTLGYFEIFTKYISNAINLDKIKYGNRRPMYGSILSQLGDFQSDGNLVFSKGGLRKFFNVDLRNALGNDDWWLNHNSEFTFKEEDNTEISLSIGEQWGDLAGINAIVESFLENYLTKFNQEMLKQIKSDRPELFDYKTALAKP